MPGREAIDRLRSYLLRKDLWTCYAILAGSLLLFPQTAEAGGEAQYQAGLKFYQAKQYKQAAEQFWTSIKNGNATPQAWLYLGHSRNAAGQKEEALRTYKEIARIFHGQPAESMALSAIRQLNQNTLQQSGKGKSTSSSAVNASTASSSGTTSGSSSSTSYNSSLPERARVFYRTDGDDIILSVRINGRSLEMEFDTGAPDICIDKSHLGTLGLRIPRTKPDGYSGGATNSIKVPYWEIASSVQVGPIRMDSLPITVFEKMHSKPLLGQDFFRDFNYTIDHKAKCIEFTRKGAHSGGGSFGYKVPFTFRKSGSRIVVEVEINGRKGPMMFDTGNTSSGISFDSVKQAEKYGVKVPPNARIGKSIGISGEGAEYKFTLDRVKLGPIEKNNLPTDVGLDINSDDEELPLVGQDMLSGWQYSIDMKNKVINFLRR